MYYTGRLEVLNENFPAVSQWDHMICFKYCELLEHMVNSTQEHIRWLLNFNRFSFFILQADHKLSYALTHCDPQSVANLRFFFFPATSWYYVWILIEVFLSSWHARHLSLPVSSLLLLGVYLLRVHLDKFVIQWFLSFVIYFCIKSWDDNVSDFAETGWSWNIWYL